MTTWRDRAEELICNSETIRAEQVVVTDEAWRVLTRNAAAYLTRMDDEWYESLPARFEAALNTKPDDNSVAEAAVGYSLT